jgi:glycosyltransferase involved in cell wall biosynthesis
MPKVSIIITCYNLGAYLEEALGSALSQSYPDFEVLLVDDGSTDAETIALLDRLPTHPRLRVLRTPNQGVARARNCGISAASGVYILPLDADDRITPAYLAHAVPILDQCSEVGFVGCHYRTFGERQDEYTASSYSLPALLVENTVPIASVFRREAWQKIGGYCPELNSIEDWDLWIGMLEAGYTGHVLPNMFFEYRIRPNSNLSHIQQPEVYRQRMALLYERHRKLYDAYAYSVLIEKDVQFAKLLSYTRWLEQQRHSWEQVAHERLVLIETIDKRAGQGEQRRQWWRRQVQRWQRIVAENPRVSARFMALTHGAWRALKRQLHKFVSGLMSKAGLIKKH